MPRFTLDYDTEFENTLKDLQQNSSAKTKADVIRDALAVYSYLKKSTPSVDGVQKVTVRNGENKEKETDLILP
jgi:hypothetical protein